MKWTDEELSERLKKLRTSRKLTQAELTKKLAAEGISMAQAQLARLEKGARSLRMVEAAALCNIFDVSMNTLAGGIDCPLTMPTAGPEFLKVYRADTVRVGGVASTWFALMRYALGFDALGIEQLPEWLEECVVMLVEGNRKDFADGQ